MDTREQIRIDRSGSNHDSSVECISDSSSGTIPARRKDSLETVFDECVVQELSLVQSLGISIGDRDGTTSTTYVARVNENAVGDASSAEFISNDREVTHTFSGGILGPTGDAARGKGGGAAERDCRADLRKGAAAFASLDSAGIDPPRLSFVCTDDFDGARSWRNDADELKGTVGLGSVRARARASSNICR